MAAKADPVGKIATRHARGLVNQFENCVFDLTAINFTRYSAEDVALIKLRYEAAKKNLLTYMANK